MLALQVQICDLFPHFVYMMMSNFCLNLILLGGCRAARVLHGRRNRVIAFMVNQKWSIRSGMPVLVRVSYDLDVCS